MKANRLLLLLLVALTSVPLTATTIYKIVKPDGTVVYSDVPAEGAKPADLPLNNTTVIPQLAKVQPTQPAKVAAEVPQYQIMIHSPAAEETIRNNAGQVQVRFEITPDYPGKFELLVDNQVVNTKGRMALTLENIERGEHSIEVRLADKTGKIFASSGKQRFYLHKASALINAN